MPPIVGRVELTSPEAQALIAALNEELIALYPEDDPSFFALGAHEVAPGRGAFLVARAGEGGPPIACGAVRLLDASSAEVKRMYTVPAARGRGIAAAVLAALEAEARALGATRMLLETGVRQQGAIRIYERAGYARTEPYGIYVDSPLSVYMAKRL